LISLASFLRLHSNHLIDRSQIFIFGALHGKLLALVSRGLELEVTIHSCPHPASSLDADRYWHRQGKRQGISICMPTIVLSPFNGL